MRNLKQYIRYITAPTPGGKLTKQPIDPNTGTLCSVNDESAWVSYDEAVASPHGEGVGFCFTEDDNIAFFDADDAAVNGQWSEESLEAYYMLEGAHFEVSMSGKGFHIFFRYLDIPPHRCKNMEHKFELYHKDRFVALTSEPPEELADCTEGLRRLVAAYFQPTDGGDMEWREGAEDSYTGPEDDDKLIEMALRRKSVAATFGDKATFEQLWTCDVDALSVAFPDAGGQGRAYDESSADASLASHLAFWTGRNPERMLRLMWRSELKRDKWEREDYLRLTVSSACGMCTRWYDKAPVAALEGWPELKGTELQVEWAEDIRARRVAEDGLGDEYKEHTDADFWIKTRQQNFQELEERRIAIRSGVQIMSVEQQLEYFAGWTYVIDQHKMLGPTGKLYPPANFNAMMGGYSFEMQSDGKKPTRKAFDCFTETQLATFPKVSDTCFKPRLAFGTIVNDKVNCYVCKDGKRTVGDVTPFIEHLRKLLPNREDRLVLASYLAACVQHRGIKFQWAPLVQGTEGNGKSLFTAILRYVLGEDYIHTPNAADLDNKFNSWLLNKLVICVEDIYVGGSRREVMETLKPMITAGNGIEIQGKGGNQITAEVCCNFILNSNHKDAIIKTQGDRRYAILYTAQQEASDLAKDGMDGDYFPNLYGWLKSGGFALVAEWLHTFDIPERYNPAGKCHRAPDTTSTAEALEVSMGPAACVLKEAIESERVGFRGGWMSSTHIKNVLAENGVRLGPNKLPAVIREVGYELRVEKASRASVIDGGARSRLYRAVGDGEVFEDDVTHYEMSQTKNGSGQG